MSPNTTKFGRRGNEHDVADGNQRQLALRFDLVAIGLVLWLKVEVLVGWPKEHLTATRLA